MAEFLTDEQLDAIGARHAAATKGPWKVGGKYREHLVDGSPEDPEACPIVCAAPANELGYAWWTNGNAVFIANAHADVALLVAETRRLRARLLAIKADHPADSHAGSHSAGLCNVFHGCGPCDAERALDGEEPPEEASHASR